MDSARELFAAVDRGDVAGAAGVLAASPSAIHGHFHGATALHRAAARGDLALLALLLEHGARLEARDEGGSTALAWASDAEQDPAVDLLLSHGARAGAVDLAARGRVPELIQLLEESPWMLEERTAQGTPLHAAARRGRTAAVECLLAQGANALERDDDGCTPLELARARRHADVVARIEQELARRSDSEESGGGSSSVSESVSYRCGACVEEIVIEVDRTQGDSQRFVEDCPVCCRANVIEVRFERGIALAEAELE